MAQKRIICTVTNDLTYDRRMIRICTSLANAGYEVKLVGRLLSSSKLIQDQAFQQKRISCFFNKGKAFYLEYTIRLFFYLLFQKKAIYYAVDLDTIFPNYWMAKLKRSTCVYDAHEYFSEVPEVIDRPLVKQAWEGIANYTIPKLKHCYTVGEELAQEFQRRYGTPFSVVRNVPPLLKVEEKPTNLTDKKVILYQGALNEGRGIEAMLYAMRGIEDAVLWIIGEGDLSNELRALAKELHLGEKVEFWGFVTPDKLAAITQQAYIGLNLLENRGLSYYFSLANKTFDYIQAELPAIHMCFPEYQHINTQYEVAILLDDLQVENLQIALHRILHDRVFYDYLKRNCKKAKEQYNWEQEEAHLLKFWDRLIKEV